MYQPTAGSTITQFITYAEFKKYISSFDLISILFQLQKHSALMKNQIHVNVKMEIDYRVSPKIEHEFLLSKHCLSFLSKEAALNCKNTSRNFNDLDFVNCINAYENLISDLNHEATKDENDKDSWLWVLRATNLQHFYTRIPSHIIARYYYIFSNIQLYFPDFETKIKALLNINFISIIKIGFFVWALVNQNTYFQKSNILNSPVFSRNGFTEEDLDIFMSLFSSNVSDLKRGFKNFLIKDILLKKYEFNPLRVSPIISTQSDVEREKFIIPSLGDFAYAFSEGIYYLLLDTLEKSDKKQYLQSIGSVFESYVGNLLKYYNIDILSRCVIFPEQKYKIKKQEKKSADWILVSDEYILQIECKKRKFDNYSKAGIDGDSIGINYIITDVAEQLDKLIQKEDDILNNRINSIKYSKQKIINIIVYLDEMFSIDIYARNAIKSVMKSKSDNFLILGCYEFEALCQLCRESNCGIYQSLDGGGSKILAIQHNDFLADEAKKILVF